MRGSPLIRFILLTLALIATGLGLMRLTSAKADDLVQKKEQPAAETSAEAAYRLVLSAPAAEVKIDTGRSAPSVSPEKTSVTGKLLLDPANPHVSLVVRWKNPPADGEQRFAKLTLEAPGKDTFTHVFDASGDIDDFLELPIK